jgi:hypothetical protein
MEGEKEDLQAAAIIIIRSNILLEQQKCLGH